MPQSAWIGIDNRLQLRAALLHSQELVHLFLVLHDRKAGLSMLEDKLHFLGARVLIQRYRHSTQALRRGHGPVQVWTVVADDRYFVSACQAHGCQPTGPRSYFVVHLAPGPGLPDTEIFFTHSDLVGVLSGTVEQQLGKRIKDTIVGHTRVLCRQ